MRHEFESIFDRNVVPKDLNNMLVGVSDVSEFSLIVEDRKIASQSTQAMMIGFENVMKSIENSKTWIIELEGYKLSKVMLNEDFFNEFCNKASNPNTLTKRCALFMDDCSYWTDNVYFDAF